MQAAPIVLPATPVATSPNFLTNGIQAVRNAIMTIPQTLNLNGQQIQLPQGMLPPGDCTCNQAGCTGTGCANLNGCFCVGNSCWGSSCQASLIAAQQQQGSQFVNGMMQTNVQGNSQQQQGGNFIDIPGLFGGGGGFEGQTIPVVQGFPVTRLRGQGARRFRPRGSMTMSSGRVRRRMRPHIRQKMNEIQFQENEPDKEGASTTGRPERSMRTRMEHQYGIHFDNDFLPFKTEVTKEKLPYILENGITTEEYDSENPEPTTSATKRHERFAQKLQKSLAKFLKSPPQEDEGTDEAERRHDYESNDEPLVFAEDVLNVNILTLDDNDLTNYKEYQ